MRRVERQITDILEIKKFLDSSIFGVLSISGKNNQPYGVPICFGYQWKNSAKFPIFYMHSAKEGKKLDLIKQNSHSCFTIPQAYNIVYEQGKPPCTASLNFASVIAEGESLLINDEKEKIEALQTFIKHFKIPSAPFNSSALKATKVIKFVPTELTMKKYK